MGLGLSLPAIDFAGDLNVAKGGVRFTLLDCPNALAWTITTGYPPARDKVLIHATINRERKHEEFVEEIHDFLNDWEKGLIGSFNSKD